MFSKFFLFSSRFFFFPPQLEFLIEENKWCLKLPIRNFILRLSTGSRPYFCLSTLFFLSVGKLALNLRWELAVGVFHWILLFEQMHKKCTCGRGICYSRWNVAWDICTSFAEAALETPLCSSSQVPKECHGRQQWCPNCLDHCHPCGTLRLSSRLLGLWEINQLMGEHVLSLPFR